jgi:TolA-binding protein
MSHADEMNARALAEQIRAMRGDIEKLEALAPRVKLLEGTVANQEAAIKQLQDLFAERTVARGSGPTT